MIIVIGTISMLIIAIHTIDCTVSVRLGCDMSAVMQLLVGSRVVRNMLL